MLYIYSTDYWYYNKTEKEKEAIEKRNNAIENCEDLKVFDNEIGTYIGKMKQIVFDGVTVKADETLADYIEFCGWDSVLKIETSYFDTLELDVEDALSIVAGMFRADNKDYEDKIYNADNIYDAYNDLIHDCINKALIYMFENAIHELQEKCNHVKEVYNKTKELDFNIIY